MNKNRTRVITAIIMGIVMIPFIILGGYPFYILMIALSVIGTYELVKMHNDKREISHRFNYAIPILSALIVTSVMLIDMGIIVNGLKYFIFMMALMCTCLLVLPLFSKELKMTDGFFYIASIFYAGCSFAIMGVIRNISLTSAILKIGSLNISTSGLFIYLYMLLTSMLTDVFAYEVGRRCGKHKLIPEVSPNKTIEGSVGGTIVSSIVSTCVLVIAMKFCKFNIFGVSSLVLNITFAFILSLFLSLVSQFGDLIASKLKREYEIKDYGKLFPGHGGVMDRFDSLILVSFCFFIILALLGVVLC